MNEFATVEEILDFAIKEEEAAAQFYTELARRAEKAWMKESLEEFAREEAGHKARLLDVKNGRQLLSAADKVSDLKVSDFVVDVTPSVDLDYQEILIIAMKKEKAAFRLYTALAGATEEPDLKDVFLGLANEEAKHKLRFEVEYDEEIFKEN